MSDILAELDAWLDDYDRRTETGKDDIEIPLVLRARDEIVALRKRCIAYIAHREIVRAEALEEAARLADGYCMNCNLTDDLARAIRALKEKA